MDAVRKLASRLRLPLIGAPMHRVSGPEWVVALCAAGVLGTFPARGAHPQTLLAEWLRRIETGLDALGHTDRPAFGVHLATHPDNARWHADLHTCESFRVPVMLTARQACERTVDAVHAWGGLVLHDITHSGQARQAIDAGVDGLVLVCAGGGGHDGAVHPFALVNDIRAFYDGPIVLSGCIGHGKDILAAQVLGCDMAAMGTRFIVTDESLASHIHRRMVLDAETGDSVATDYFNGTVTRYLAQSLIAAGLDPALLQQHEAPIDASMRPTSWRNICRAGQGVGGVQESLSVAALVDQLHAEYLQAQRSLPRLHEPVSA